MRDGRAEPAADVAERTRTRVHRPCDDQAGSLASASLGSAAVRSRSQHVRLAAEPAYPVSDLQRRMGYHAAWDAMPCGIPCHAGYHAAWDTVPLWANRAAWDTVPRGIPCRMGYAWDTVPHPGLTPTGCDARALS